MNENKVGQCFPGRRWELLAVADVVEPFERALRQHNSSCSDGTSQSAPSDFVHAGNGNEATLAESSLLGERRVDLPRGRLLFTLTGR